MSDANRMKWNTNPVNGVITSACGRFIIRRFCMDPKHRGYVGLTDTTTGIESPCRTIDSAKRGALNLLRSDVATTDQPAT